MNLQDYILLNNVQKASTADMILSMGNIIRNNGDITVIWKKIRIIRQLQDLFNKEVVKEEYDLSLIIGSINYINYLLGSFKRPGGVVIYPYLIITEGNSGNVSPVVDLRFTDLLDAPDTIEPLKFLRGNASGTALEFVDIPEPEAPILTEDIPVSNPDLGIDLPYTFTNGTTFTNAWKKLVQKLYEPTFIAPTFGLSNNAGLREVGQIFSITLSFNFNRGRINGNIVGGVWVPSAQQNPRAGAATEYILSGASTGTNNSRTFSVTANQGLNIFTGTVSYEEGPQPLNSDNKNFSTPLSAGTSPSQTTSFEGVYPLFATSSNITTATKQTLVSMLTANNIQINLVSETGDNKQFFEIPDAWLALRTLSYIQYFNTVSGQFDTTNKVSDFTITSVTETIQGNTVSYKRYTYNGSDRANILIRLTFS